MKWAAAVLVSFWSVCFVAPHGSASDSGTGTISGVVEVQKTRILTKGPKSFKDVVIFLEPMDAGNFQPPAQHAVMDQKGLVFIPHVMAVQKGMTVDFLNSDNDRHNVYFLFDETGDTLDIGTWGPGQSVSYTFVKSGLVIVLCQLHLEMAAYILVLDTPFFAVANIDEKDLTAPWRIDGVPAGEYRLTAWHKKLKMKEGPIKVTMGPDQSRTVDLVITEAKYAKK